MLFLFNLIKALYKVFQWESDFMSLQAIPVFKTYKMSVKIWDNLYFCVLYEKLKDLYKDGVF